MQFFDREAWVPAMFKGLWLEVVGSLALLKLQSSQGIWAYASDSNEAKEGLLHSLVMEGGGLQRSEHLVAALLLSECVLLQASHHRFDRFGQVWQRCEGTKCFLCLSGERRHFWPCHMYTH